MCEMKSPRPGRRARRVSNVTRSVAARAEKRAPGARDGDPAGNRAVPPHLPASRAGRTGHRSASRRRCSQGHQTRHDS
ncbi:hypothetical protein GN956_G5396 [Arapaima gigas]